MQHAANMACAHVSFRGGTWQCGQQQTSNCTFGYALVHHVVTQSIHIAYKVVTTMHNPSPLQESTPASTTTLGYRGGFSTRLHSHRWVPQKGFFCKTHIARVLLAKTSTWSPVTIQEDGSPNGVNFTKAQSSLSEQGVNSRGAHPPIPPHDGKQQATTTPCPFYS